MAKQLIVYYLSLHSLYMCTHEQSAVLVWKYQATPLYTLCCAREMYILLTWQCFFLSRSILHQMDLKSLMTRCEVFEKCFFVVVEPLKLIGDISIQHFYVSSSPLLPRITWTRILNHMSHGRSRMRAEMMSFPVWA